MCFASLASYRQRRWAAWTMPGAKLQVSERTVGGTDRSEKERNVGVRARGEPIPVRDDSVPAWGEPKIARGMEMIDLSDAP